MVATPPASRVRSSTTWTSPRRPVSRPGGFIAPRARAVLRSAPPPPEQALFRFRQRPQESGRAKPRGRRYQRKLRQRDLLRGEQAGGVKLLAFRWRDIDVPAGGCLSFSETACRTP